MNTRLDIDRNIPIRLNKPGLRMILGDFEYEVMNIVWSKADPTITVRNVYDVVRRKRDLPYTTVMSTMLRLAEKGILRILDKTGRSNCYVPAETRHQFKKHFVETIFSNFSADFPNEVDLFIAGMKEKRS